MFELADKKLVALLAPVGLAVGLSLGASNVMAGQYVTSAGGIAVTDSQGQCWTSKGAAEQKLAGCGDQTMAMAPKDSDGDGVPDSKDHCPGTPRGVAVDANGCPLDSDGDGVPDYLDKCPGTPAGTKVDASGCPVAAPMAAAAIDTTVEHFDFDSAKLKPAMKSELDKIAAKVKGTSQKLEVIGYTDSTGPAAYNQMLSERRAQAAAAYLESMGVKGTTVKGMGEKDPVASNKTRAGRSMNRRVEVRSK